MTDPIEALKAALAAAPPGTWTQNPAERRSVTAPCGASAWIGSFPTAKAEAMAAYIAAASPDVIRSLIERLEAAEADARRLDALQNAALRDGWIVAKNVDSFTVGALSGRCGSVTRATLRETIDAAIDSAIAGKDTP